MTSPWTSELHTVCIIHNLNSQKRDEVHPEIDDEVHCHNEKQAWDKGKYEERTTYQDLKKFVQHKVNMHAVTNQATQLQESIC